MTQYVIQIRDSDNYFARSYEVDEKHPVCSPVPPGRSQLVTENTELYNAAVEFYRVYNVKSEYFLVEDVLSWKLRV